MQVYVVTGANSGVGKELAHILYSNNAKVYAAARSKSKATEAIDELRGRSPKSTGELVFLHLDLADLVSVKAAAEEFLAQESRLDVLFNNAGVMAVPHSRTVQGYETHLGTNNVGPFLFTRLLTPTLAATAKAEAEAGRPGAVRVVWVSSSATEGFAPSGGVEVDKLDYREEKTWMYKYGVSKAGNYLHATEYARRHRDHGIVSVALNPGNLRSDLWRTVWSHFVSFLRAYFLFPPIYGAYTQLFAGLSPDVSLEKSGAWSEFSLPFFLPSSRRVARMRQFINR